MVRRGSRRSSATAPVDSPLSPTQTAMDPDKARTMSPRRIRGNSPVGARQSQLHPRRRSRRSSQNKLMNWSDDLDHSENDNAHDLGQPQHSTLDMVPSHWTTESGKFDPRQSEMNFDARSNAAININLRYSRRNNNTNNEDEKSLSNGSGEDSHGDSSEDNPNKSSHKRSKKKEGPLDGEIEDPHERHQFYKKLKKAGIKKTFQIASDWETNSANSEVSEVSFGNASYILDLAQQKESRKKDREEEALEEALELYGTWLTEGKTDDKNIFLMILNEVKKEQKQKYKKIDKKHAALLDQALDEELARREQLKREEKEKEEAKLKEKKKDPEEDDPRKRNKPMRKKSFHQKQTEAAISEIITSQNSMDQDESQKESIDDDDDNSFYDDEGDDSHTDLDDIDEEEADFDPKKPRSGDSRGLLGSMRNLGESMRKLGLDGGSSHHERRSHHERTSLQKKKGFFGRLKTKLTERKAEETKILDASWRANCHVVTEEELWWKKINDAKKEKTLFEREKSKLDQTNNTAPISSRNGMQSLDFTTRSHPTACATIPETPSPKNKNLDGSNTSTLESGSPAAREARFQSKKKKTKDLDASERSISTAGKKKKKKSSKIKHEAISETLDLEDSKSQKRKDKKKKKKTKSLESTASGKEGSMRLNDVESPTKKKKERYSRRVSVDSDDRSVGSSKSTRSNRSTRSSKSTRSTGSKKKKTRTDKSHRKQRKVKSISIDSSDAEKHSKKKKNRSSAYSSEEFNSSDGSLDWTDRCISTSPSNETAGNTVLTSESVECH